jgi:predicted small integral membrane protein
MSLHDVIGAAGVVCIVGSYALLQARRLRADAVRYSLLNAVGASLILVSLAVDFNAAAALVEGFWLLISLWGLLRAWRGPSA